MSVEPPARSRRYAGRRASLSARYARSTRRPSWNHELDYGCTPARRRPSTPRGRPAPVLGLEAGAPYEDTTMARELNVITGLDTPRARRAAARPAPRSRWASDTPRASGPSTRSRASRLPGFRPSRPGGVGPPAAADARLPVREPDPQRAPLRGGGSTTRSHVLALGWTRQVTPRARFDFKAGPRFRTTGRSGPDVRRGTATFPTETRSVLRVQHEATAVGQPTRLDVTAEREAAASPRLPRLQHRRRPGPLPERGPRGRGSRSCTGPWTARGGWPDVSP